MNRLPNYLHRRDPEPEWIQRLFGSGEPITNCNEMFVDGSPLALQKANRKIRATRGKKA